MSRIHQGLGWIAAIAGTAATVWASHLPVSLPGSGEAALRLAWRARPDRIEECRPQDEEVLERLPPHMRQAMICEGVSATYMLEVRRDGAVIVERVVAGGGLRRDRPLYVFQEIPIPEGEATMSVRFTRREAGESTRGDAVPAELSLERRLRFETGRVILVTYEPERRELVVMDR